MHKLNMFRQFARQTIFRRPQLPSRPRRFVLCQIALQQRIQQPDGCVEMDPGIFQSAVFDSVRAQPVHNRVYGRVCGFLIQIQLFSRQVRTEVGVLYVADLREAPSQFAHPGLAQADGD